MLGLFRHRRDSHSVHALQFGADEITYAAVTRNPEAEPVLRACEHLTGLAPTDWPAALVGLRKRHGLDRTRCSLLLGEQTYALLLVEAPKVPREEIRDAVGWRIQDLIDFHIDDAVIDVFDLPQSGSGTEMIYAAVSRKADLQQFIAMMHDSGLNLEIIEIEELASRNLAAELPEDAAGVAFVRMGMQRGLITLSRKGLLYLARRIDSGYGALLDGEAGFDEWSDRLLIEVQRSLDYFEGNFREAPIDHLVVAPPPVEVPHLASEMAARSGLNVRLLDVNQLIEAPDDMSLDTRLRCLPAIGAALRDEGRTP